MTKSQKKTKNWKNIIKGKSEDINELKELLKDFHSELKELQGIRNSQINKQNTIPYEKPNQFKRAINKRSDKSNSDNNIANKDKKDDSTLSFSAKFSTPDKGIHKSSKGMNKVTVAIGTNMDEMFANLNSSRYSVGSVQNAKEIYYLQPKYNIPSTTPANVPKIKIEAIRSHESIQTQNSNLNKAFEMSSLKSLEDLNDGPFNLESIPKKEYNEEFMKEYKDFSVSWKNNCNDIKTHTFSEEK